MLEELDVRGVTLFAEAQSFRFVPGLNVIIGGNASGKSHLLKLAFTVSKWSRRLARQEPELDIEAGLARDAARVFGSSCLAGLCSIQGQGAEASVQAHFSGGASLGFSWDATGQAHLDAPLHPCVPAVEGILIPPREVLSIYPCFAQVGRAYPDLMDGASWELCCALEVEPTQPLSEALLCVKQQIDDLLGGVISREQGRFYLKVAGAADIELGLMAEGFKRLGTLGLLLQNGKLRAGHMLCWDEAEMNLNICHLSALVNIILDLVRAGVQVMLTTHSLFLLRELHLRLAEGVYQDMPRRFILLQAAAPLGLGVKVDVADCLDELPVLSSMSAELAQADRYLSLSYE